MRKPGAVSLQMVLEREGHEVEAVENVDGALQRFGTRHFDLILCDYRMPGKTGIDLLRELAEPVRRRDLVDCAARAIEG